MSIIIQVALSNSYHPISTIHHTHTPTSKIFIDKHLQFILHGIVRKNLHHILSKDHTHSPPQPEAYDKSRVVRLNRWIPCTLSKKDGPAETYMSDSGLSLSQHQLPHSCHRFFMAQNNTDTSVSNTDRAPEITSPFSILSAKENLRDIMHMSCCCTDSLKKALRWKKFQFCRPSKGHLRYITFIEPNKWKLQLYLVMDVRIAKF